MKPNFLKVAEDLGGSLAKLMPRRAKREGEPSPGMVMTLEFENGSEKVNVDFDEWLVKRIEGAINGSVS